MILAKSVPLLLSEVIDRYFCRDTRKIWHFPNAHHGLLLKMNQNVKSEDILSS